MSKSTESGFLANPRTRSGTASLKWDLPPGSEYPLWVADMDAAAPSAVMDALHDRLKHDVLGYGITERRSLETFASWCTARQGWTPDPRHLQLCPGLMPAITMAILAFTAPGDPVIIQTPVYYPFMSVVTTLGRRLILNPLVRDESIASANPYRMDLHGLEQTLVSLGNEGAKNIAMIFCSPHNPVSRVWSQKELADLIGLAQNFSMRIISDEIHADLVPRYPATPAAGFRSIATVPGAEAVCTVIQAPSKTFNIPGIPLAQVWNAKLQDLSAFRKAQSGIGQESVSIVAQTAMRAAYSECGSWLDGILASLARNLELVRTFLSKSTTVSLVEPEGTYLLWLDIGKLASRRGLGTRAVQEALRKEQGIWLSAGSQFGEGGEGFLRLNIATNQDFLEEAMTKFVAWTEA